MVSSIPGLYTDYRVNTQPDGQSPADVRRPGFVNIPKEIDTALSRDIKEMKENLNFLSEKFDRFERSSKLDIAEKALFVGGVIPTVRRLNTIPKDLEEDNWQRPALLTGVAALSLPGDWREVRAAGEQLYDAFTNKTVSPIANSNLPHKLTLLKGTFLESLLKEYPRLAKIDNTLYNTDFRKQLFNIFRIEDPVITPKTIGKNIVDAYDFKGGFFKKLVGTSLLRVPILGLGLSLALEMPAIIKSARVEGSFTDKVKSVSKQVCKSLGFVGLMNGGMAIAGAAAFILLPGLGAAAALGGMAIGSVLGVMASKELNKHIDDVFA